VTIRPGAKWRRLFQRAQEKPAVVDYTLPVVHELTDLPEDQELSAERWESLMLQNDWRLARGTSPAVYREGTRGYLRGVIEAGATAVGTVLFDVGPDYGPGSSAWPWTMTDAGPVVLEVSAGGVVKIADGPFEAGNGWLLLDGISWPWSWELQPFYHWGQEDVYFGSEALDVPYSELS
jgi:hypothetical protein